jgi:thioredoxin 1
MMQRPLTNPVVVNRISTPFQQHRGYATDDVTVISSEEEFDKILKENSFVAVDFFATWCGPCKMIAPVFKQMSADFPDVAFVTVDVGQVESLAARYSVSSIPHFLFLKDGEVVDTMTGASKPLLKSKLEAMK